jgi:hypothetical protein
MRILEITCFSSLFLRPHCRGAAQVGFDAPREHD